jgi:hypothetical protein
MESSALVGVDRALVRLYRSIGLRRHLKDILQTESPLFNMTTLNITTAYKHLQLYNDYDGSYSFMSDDSAPHSSLYLTSLAFGAMISPMMPFYDKVALNRTLNFILSYQQQDGSFDDNGPYFHYQFCSGEFRRESLTAIVLYSLTRENATRSLPIDIHHRLFDGENSPINSPGEPIRSVDPIVFNRIRVGFHRNSTESDEIMVGSGRISSRAVEFR